MLRSPPHWRGSARICRIPNGGVEISTIGGAVKANAAFSTHYLGMPTPSATSSATSSTAGVLYLGKRAWGTFSQPGANSVITALGLMTSVIAVSPWDSAARRLSALSSRSALSGITARRRVPYTTDLRTMAVCYGGALITSRRCISVPITFHGGAIESH